MTGERKKRLKSALVCTAAMALAAQGGVALASGNAQTLPDVQASISDTGEATVTTNNRGMAVVRLEVAAAGDYSIASVGSESVEGDTVGTLYNSSFTELASNDDNNADTNFTISYKLSAGTYYVAVMGKNSQAGARITVGVSQGTSIATLRSICAFDASGNCSSFALGTWSKGGRPSFTAADAASYSVGGYIDRELFKHAVEDDAVSQIKWKAGLPTGPGRFVVKASAVEGEQGLYTGSAFFDADNSSSNDLAELFPQIGYATCGAVKRIDLCTVSIVPTNWQADYKPVSSSYYTNAGYVERSAFEAAGSDASAVKWKKGLPNQEGRYVVKFNATKVKKNPYSGTAYAWIELSDLHHAGAGKWVTEKKATKIKPGSRYLKCKYCKGKSNVTVIPATKK